MGKYSVLILEDEPQISGLVRDYITKVSDRYTVVGEYNNGLKGLEALKRDKVDIVITDIEMPVMGGIEFINKALEFNSDLKIIVLTAYNDFELVRECFLLGVVNYIVKTEIDYEKLIGVLDNTVSKITDSSEKLKTMVEKLIGNKFVDNNLVDKITSKGINLKTGNVKIIDIKIHNFKRLLSEKWNYDEMMFSYGVENILTEILSMHPLSFVSFYKYNGEFVVLISFKDVHSEMQIHRVMFEFFQSFESSLKSLGDMCVTIGISSAFISSKSYNDLYAEAEIARSVNFFENRSNYCVFERKYADCSDESDFSPIASAFSNLLNTFSSDYPESLPALTISDNEKNIHNIKFLKSNVEKIYYNILSYCVEIGNTNEYSKNFFEYEEYLKEDANFYELYTWLSNIYEKLLQDSRANGGIIREIKRYVAQNENKQPMLMDFAKEMGMSPTYLSKLFKTETGMNFTDYVTGYKIEKSVEYMKTTNMNISEISYSLGYSNVETFSRVFKRVMQKTPKDYLKKIKK